jgi:hypothetical protein
VGSFYTIAWYDILLLLSRTMPPGCTEYMTDVFIVLSSYFIIVRSGHIRRLTTKSPGSGRTKGRRILLMMSLLLSKRRRLWMGWWKVECRQV